MSENQGFMPVKALFNVLAGEIRPMCEEEAKKHGVPLSEETFKAMVAQNALRICIETVLRECLPYNARFCAELGVHLAAYCVTATPIECHHALIMAIQEALPRAIETKLREGAIIRSTWNVDGKDRPNVPEKSELQ